MTENELKKTVLGMAYAAGWRVYHVPQATIRGSQGRGYPDLTLARRGMVLWLELKQQDGKVRSEQTAWMAELPKGTAHVIRPSDIETLGEMLR